MVSPQTSPQDSPASSRPSTSSSRGTRTPLSLDLSAIPPLVQPSPPSNTLLITNLQDPLIFRADHLLTLRDLIDSSAPIHTWAPLKSFRRIVVSFSSSEDAIRIRQLLDGEVIMGEQVRIYFGENTALEPVDQHLQAPKSQKLFFISPPPSPPHGWEMKNEEPPNKEVHATDLAEALQKLHARPLEPAVMNADELGGQSYGDGRKRSGSSTVLFEPSAEEKGNSPNMPAIAVEDTTHTPDDWSPIDNPSTKVAHTARPPVELMQDA